jgi:hypothetical protein
VPEPSLRGIASCSLPSTTTTSTTTTSSSSSCATTASGADCCVSPPGGGGDGGGGCFYGSPRPRVASLRNMSSPFDRWAQHHSPQWLIRACRVRGPVG